MTDNKLIKLFNSLNGVEKRGCTKFLESPFFNQKVEVIRLWSWLLLQKKENLQDDKAAINASIYSFQQQNFAAAKWRHLQSQLYGLIEKFLAQRALSKQSINEDLKLIPTLRQKKLPQSIGSVLRRAEDRLDRLPRDIDYYYYQYQIEWEKYATFESLERGEKNNLAGLGQALDVYIIASKLRLACMMQSHQAVYQTEYDVTFLPAILEFVAGSEMKNIPAIALYYFCYQAINSGTESDFFSLRKELKKQEEALPAQERRAFLLLAINYCIKQLNTGEKRYVREALDLYQTGLETKTLIADGHLSRFAYKNIVALALNLKEFNWVKKFIDDYAIYLEEAHRTANHNYNLAKLYYAKKEFQKAMPMLAQIGDRDLLLNLDSKVMLLKMYYDMREFDALDSLLSSFRIQLLRKKKIIGYHQLHYLNIVRYTKKMIGMNRFDKKKIAAFKKEVAENKMVIEKDWLLERIGG